MKNHNKSFVGGTKQEGQQKKKATKGRSGGSDSEVYAGDDDGNKEYDEVIKSGFKDSQNGESVDDNAEDIDLNDDDEETINEE